MQQIEVYLYYQCLFASEENGQQPLAPFSQALFTTNSSNRVIRKTKPSTSQRFTGFMKQKKNRKMRGVEKWLPSHNGVCSFLKRQNYRVVFGRKASTYSCIIKSERGCNFDQSSTYKPYLEMLSFLFEEQSIFPSSSEYV